MRNLVPKCRPHKFEELELSPKLSTSYLMLNNFMVHTVKVQLIKR